jgi:hypothetical protein
VVGLALAVTPRGAGVTVTAGALMVTLAPLASVTVTLAVKVPALA